MQDVENTQKYPRLLISEDCPELIDTIPNCVYAKDKNDEEIDDVAEFEGDDPYDTLRYLARAMVRFIIESKNSQQAFAEIQAIQDKLNNGGDMTEFYRMMEIRESHKPQKFGRKRARRRYVDCSPGTNSGGPTEGFTDNRK